MAKLLITKIIVFLILLYLPLFFLQKAVDNGLRKYRAGEYGVWNDIYNSKINSKVLVVGSSRALVNISTSILDSMLKKSVYNIGVDGGHFSQTLQRFKIYLMHNKKPEAIICSLGMSDLEKTAGLFNMEQYLPYLGDSLIAKSNKGYANSFISADYYVPSMKYRVDLGSILTGLKLYFDREVNIKDPRVRGYEARNLKWDTSFDDLKKSGKSFDIRINQDAANDLEEFVNVCRLNKIKLIFVYTPEYIEIQPYFKNRDFVMDFYRSFSRKNEIPFIDYSKDSLSFNKSLFYNSEHLNLVGSKLFSQKLAADLIKCHL
jgi:hypothetical protein